MTDDLQLLDVFSEISGRHSLVHLLEAGKCVELLDACLDVMPGDLFALGNARQIDLLHYAFVGLENDGRIVGAKINAKITLRSQHGQPQPAL